LAGLFEGEGCLSRVDPASGKPRWQLRVSMTDRDVVERVAAVAGVGHIGSIYPPSFRRRGYQKQWVWNVHAANSIYALVVAIFPWLGVRRQAKCREFVAEFLTGSLPQRKPVLVPVTPAQRAEICRRVKSLAL
jgi:hypothetical protein